MSTNNDVGILVRITTVVKRRSTGKTLNWFTFNYVETMYGNYCLTMVSIERDLQLNYVSNGLQMNNSTISVRNNRFSNLQNLWFIIIIIIIY